MKTNDDVKMPDGMTWGGVAKCTVAPGFIYLKGALGRMDSLLWGKLGPLVPLRMAVTTVTTALGGGYLMVAAGNLGLFQQAASAVCASPLVIVAPWVGLNLLGCAAGAAVDGVVLTENICRSVSPGNAIKRLRKIANTPVRQTLGRQKKPKLISNSNDR